VGRGKAPIEVDKHPAEGPGPASGREPGIELERVDPSPVEPSAPKIDPADPPSPAKP